MKKAEDTGVKVGLLNRAFIRMNDIRVFRCIKESLIMIVPVIMIGAFALLFKSFPFTGYQEFIKSFAGGILYTIFSYMYQATYGMMSVYMVASVAMCYASSEKNSGGYFFGPVTVSLCAFWILSGVCIDGKADFDVLGVNGIFTAMVSSVSASMLFCYIQRKFQIGNKLYARGADDIFNNMMKYLVPIIIVVLIFCILDVIICELFGISSFQEMYVLLIQKLFADMGCNLWSALFYILIEHILWFFGIHGANVLNVVDDMMFEAAALKNQELIAMGQMPSEIYTKTFFNTFVLMGGCGTTICLLLAILFLGWKRKKNRTLTKLALVPTLFNINEIVVFGLPIVFNPVLLIPFFLAPMVSLIISAAATKYGFVPIVINDIEWTTPILISGYKATGSLNGVWLQLVNLAVGTLIYCPFVRMMDQENEIVGRKNLNELEKALQLSEETRKPITVLNAKDGTGVVARLLADELEDQIGNQLPTIFYQPQYNEHGECIGAEALLRWQHPVYGLIYPPLIMKIAEELGMLVELEKDIFRAVVCDMDRLKCILGNDIKISVNVTGGTIQQDEYERFLGSMAEQYPQYHDNILIELTEQESLKIDDEFIARLTRIKNLGYKLGIDDFSMGNTSIKYLQTNVFSLIKLDGALSLDVLENARSQGIVAMIAKLSKEFDIQVLAEYVETEEQRKILEEIGCCMYQGHLYSPAINIDELQELEKFNHKGGCIKEQKSMAE